MKDLNNNFYSNVTSKPKNNRLQDLTDTSGKNLLVQWGIKFEALGANKQYRKIWESAIERPSLIIEYKGKKAFLYWVGKRQPIWNINMRIISIYNKFKESIDIPVFICFAVFDRHDCFSDFRFSVLGVHQYITSSRKEPDQSETIEFVEDLPKFKKADIIKYLL